MYLSKWRNVFVKLQNIFVQIANVFVQIDKCICSNSNPKPNHDVAHVSQFVPCIVAHVILETAEDDDDGDEDDEGGDDAPGGRGPPHEEMLGILYERRTKFVPKI